MELTSKENFLALSQCLVYIENRNPFADADGSTQIATIVRSYIQDNNLWFNVILNTDSDGDIINEGNVIIISGNNVVSDRSYKDIQQRQFYYFASSSSLEHLIKARSFVIKKNLNRPLESTSRSALGSGIYGRYVQNFDDIPSLLTDPSQSVYIIDVPNAYIVQDKEHGESITIASLNTNRYLDRIIESLRGDPVINLDIIHERIRINESPNLFTLWNIVLYRTEDIITKEQLEEIMSQYVLKYLTDASLTDSINEEFLQELPINDIMQMLGYDGILASDVYNNGWDRGCVSYNYAQANIIQGETARY